MGSLTPREWHRFAEKVLLAVESSLESHYDSGTSGLELEYNVLDEQMNPVVRVGSGPESRSFADFLHQERLPEWARSRFQLEVFSWMTEATTRPYYSPTATVAEARLLEGILLNTLSDLGLAFGERFYALHGNIPRPVETTHDSIPAGWNLARKRYLARCVDLFGSDLATAGIHTNHSFPEALLSWDFFHQSAEQRRGQTLEDFRNHAVIGATRSLRPLCPLFTAVSAASPLAWESVNGRPEVVLSNIESNRLLTFPNPVALDVPGLYASHEEYLRISYDLVRNGIRFGANNWTPIRARSGVEPVNRNILTTSEQLRELYSKGIYTLGEMGTLEEAVSALTIENLCARVDLPMNRVEVRTDEGGDSFDLAVAKVAFKELLMLHSFADPEVGAGYAYDADDLDRARRNEHAAARYGLDATLEHPHTGSSITVRELLGATLDELRSLSEGLGYATQLEPLREMAAGGPSPSTSMREWFSGRLDGAPAASSGAPIVPSQLVGEWLEERARELARDATRIAEDRGLIGPERDKLAPLVHGLRELGEQRAGLPIRLNRARSAQPISTIQGEVGEILELAAELIRRPSVTNYPDERIDEVRRCSHFVAGVLAEAGADVRVFESGRYPAVFGSFTGETMAPVTLAGHFDVVPPEPGDEQFDPRVEGDYLWGRGSADMKTVVASYLVWMRRHLRAGPPYPPMNLLLVGNEENGEAEAHGTAHVLAELLLSHAWQPSLMVVGERTGEQGHERFGEVCVENRGVIRLRLEARGVRGHTGMASIPQDLLERLVEARERLIRFFRNHLTVEAADGWRTTARFPFLNVGENRVYNITAGEGALGVEVRPIPADDVDQLLAAVTEIANDLSLEQAVDVNEAGVACPDDNPFLAPLLEAVHSVAGHPARIGRKLAGTSARFAPGGNAVVWGQSGIGPHSRDERHFIPSIAPYLDCLDEFAGLL